MEPRKTVEVLLIDRPTGPLHPRHRRVVRRFVGGRGFVPHAEREKHVRRHVQRVARCRRDLRVDPRRIQAAPIVHPVVVGVQGVVRGSRMLRILLEDRGRQLAGLERDRGIPLPIRDRAEQR